MPRSARFVWALALACLPVFVVGAGCGTDPVAVEGCRRIEEARCEVAVGCPSFAVKDVAACKRFYRDQCLHGLAIAGDPGDPVIDACVEDIRAAGACAVSSDPACVLPATDPPGATACDIIQKPQVALRCQFLAPPAAATTAPTLPTGGAGGAAGTGQAAGAAGTPAGAGGTEAAGAGGSG